MFPTTPQTLFRQLPALFKFNLQHLRLTQSEAEQLLDLLKISFRQQLDSEYGPSNTGTTTNNTKVDTNPSQKQHENGRPRLLSDSALVHKHTDRHLNSILTNPLFTQQRKYKLNEPPGDPMDTFDRAAGRGMMNLVSAKAILKAKKEQLRSLPESLEESMKRSGAGLKFLKWLTSSGLNQMDFLLKDQDLTVMLFEFMRAEGYEEVFWGWINKAIHDISATKYDDTSGMKQQFRSLTRLLCKIISLTTKLEGSFNTSISILLRVMDMAKDLSFKNSRSLLLIPGQYVFCSIFRSSQQAREATSQESFEIFQQILPVFMIHYIDMHMVDIYSPYHRSANRFLEFFRQLPPTQEAVEDRLEIPFKYAKATKMVSISLMAIKILLEQNRINDATWIMERLRTTYPKLLRIETKFLEWTSEIDEALSIRMLDSFSTA